MKDMCGCCEGLDKLTPIPIVNRPGLNTLAYRVGTHASIFESMLACLSNNEFPELSLLTTRAKDDPSIALLDAWATVADVLTFYQERIANEGYLRTATERRSILELARLIGYQLRPGVAASVYLSFTMENDFKGDIPAGTRSQSIPGPGELPQPFETSEDLAARAAWNELKPRLTRPQYITFENIDDINTVYLAGTATNLKPNDPLVFVFGDLLGEQKVAWVESTESQSEEDRTEVVLQRGSVLGIANASPTAVRQLTASACAEIFGIIDKFRNLEAYDVSPGVTSDNVLEVLVELEAQLAEGVPMSQVNHSLSVTLQKLGFFFENATTYSYEKLERWTKELIDSIQKFRDRLSVVRVVETEVQQQKLSKVSATGFADFTLGSMVDTLLVPPSQQPANALKLDRRVETIYTARGDMGPRLLTSIKTQLKDTLYKALDNIEVANPSKLQSIETMRVKAAPFGHNALLKPIYDEQGRIIDHEEWPLSDSEIVEFSVELPIGNSAMRAWLRAASAVGSMHVVATYSKGTESWRRALPFIDAEEATINDQYTFKITLHSDDEKITGATFQFLHTSGQSPTEIEVQSDDFGGIFLQVNQDTLRPITKGQTVHYLAGNRTVLAQYLQDGSSLKVSDRSLLAQPAEMWNKIFLDNEYKGVVAGSRIVIERPDPLKDNMITRILSIERVTTISRAAYGMTGKSIQLTLDEDWLYDTDVDLSVMRATTVYVQSERLPMAEEPIVEPVAGADIVLDGLYDGLESGRWVAVSGERVDISATSSVKGTELAMIAGVTQDVGKVTQGKNIVFDRPGDTIHTTIQFANSLAYKYKRDTVSIYGNVVKATHGETRTEILGSGDGSKVFQQFKLSFAPLTYVAANTPAGVGNTLQVRVNDVLWDEAISLFNFGANDRRYLKHTDNEDETFVRFGDGKRGVRLPSGTENVTATYRSGIGKGGNASAEQISLLATRPLGVKGVINPLAATGGADRETRDQARRNAPIAVMALDRLVSVRDYADFARTFAGIGKASAARIADGRRHLLHVTIAGANDIPISKTSDIYRSLRAALHTFGEPHLPIQLAVRGLILLIVHAKVRVKVAYQWETVEPKVRSALLEHFSFERRELGQDARLSEAITVIKGVAGVEYVDVDVFDGLAEVEPTVDLIENIGNLGESLGNKDIQPKQRVAAETARATRPEEYGSTPTRIKRILKQSDVYGLDLPKVVIMPAQIAVLKPDIKDTLILTELI